MKISLLCLIGFTALLYHLPQVTKASLEDEKLYIQQFGNYPYNFATWEAAKCWYDELGETHLRKFSADAHKAAGYGEAIVDTVILDVHMLKLEHENHKSREVDVLTYGINGTLWYITDGAQEGCVFYLNLADPNRMVFELQKHVCGIERLEYRNNFKKVTMEGGDY